MGPTPPRPSAASPAVRSLSELPERHVGEAARALAEERWRALYAPEELRPAAMPELPRWLTVGVAFACFTLLATYAEFETLSNDLRSAALCFLVAVPTGVIGYVALRRELGDRWERRMGPWVVFAPLAAAVIGMHKYIAHFDNGAAWFFVIVFIAWFALVSVGSNRARVRRWNQLEHLYQEVLDGDDSAEARIQAPHRWFGITDDEMEVRYPFGNRWDVTFNGVGFRLEETRSGDFRYRLNSEDERWWRLLWPRRAQRPDELRRIVKTVTDRRSHTSHTASQ